MGLLSTLTQVVLGASLAYAQGNTDSTFTPARPPSIPLAVRSPYLSCWMPVGSDGGNGGKLAGMYPQHWTQQSLGWAGYIRVDNTTYVWLGDPGQGTAVDQKEFSYTSTRSNFVMSAGGKVQMNITFLSPVTPNDLKRQSLPFSYVNIDVMSLDGANHDVSVYSDVSSEWATGNLEDKITWDYGSQDGVAYHTFQRQDQKEISEQKDMADWGTFYWSTADGKGMTYQSGADVDVRGAFVKNGKLGNTKDSNFRAANDKWPVFGFAHDLGSVGKQPANTLFTIGIAQDNAIQLLGYGDDLTTYPSLWKSYFSDGKAAMSWFFKDYQQAAQMCTDLDNRVATDSTAAAGQDYLTITSLSVRQAFGALQFTGNQSDPLIFLKEISSNSDIETVDVIFPTMPALLYFNPALLKYTLEPDFINQENGHYPNQAAQHDLGTFPLAKGHPKGDDEQMPLETSGDMIIMALAYAQRAQDTDYLNQHYKILDQWAQSLTKDNETLVPSNQISTDDFAGALANQTNLALKGIIAVRAMAEISKMVGKNDPNGYEATAGDYLKQWQGFGINKDANPSHTTLSYGDGDSYNLLYNLYANDLLNLNFVPQDVYDMQNTFYPSVQKKYGVPLDTRHGYTKTDWAMFVAATSSDKTRDMFIKKHADWIANTPTNRPMTDLYDCDTGDFPKGLQFNARPVVGGHFALLAKKSSTK